MSLTLQLAGVSVTLNNFLSSEFPRILIQQLSSVEYSAYGNPGTFGSLHEPKFMWQVTALIEKEQHLLLEAIAYEFHTRRRSLEECDILLWDTTAPIIERSPRSRAIVPAGEEILFNNGSHSQFFGQFKVAIVDGPKYTSSGRYITVTMALNETIKVLAT